MLISPGVLRADEAVTRLFGAKYTWAVMSILPPGPPNASALIRLASSTMSCESIVMLPPPPIPLCTLVVIWLLLRWTSDPLVVTEILPPSASRDSVVMVLFRMTNLLPALMVTFPASAVSAPVLLAETIARSVRVTSLPLMVIFPPGPNPSAVEKTPAPPPMLTESAPVSLMFPPAPGVADSSLLLATWALLLSVTVLASTKRVPALPPPLVLARRNPPSEIAKRGVVIATWPTSFEKAWLEMPLPAPEMRTESPALTVMSAPWRKGSPLWTWAPSLTLT